MTQAIRNIKTGQRFLVIDKNQSGFSEGSIVEALESINHIDEGRWIGGTKPYQEVILVQSIKHLKRFKGKIK